MAVDGVVFATATANSLELQKAVKHNRPLVLINRDVEGVECDRVMSENQAGGALVADFLHDNGRTQAAIVMGNPQATTSRDRTQGFLDRMRELGYSVPAHWRLNCDFSHDHSFDITRRLLSNPQRPSVIFCVNDNMAFGAIDARRELELSPSECWIVGYDDVALASWPSFDLTTIRQPSREMAAAGARLLVDRVNNPSASPRTVLFPSALVERGSTPR